MAPITHLSSLIHSYGPMEVGGDERIGSNGFALALIPKFKELATFGMVWLPVGTMVPPVKNLLTDKLVTRAVAKVVAIMPTVGRDALCREAG